MLWFYLFNKCVRFQLIKMRCISLNHIRYKKSMVSSIQTLSYFTFKVYFANSSATPLVHRCERETIQDKIGYKWCQKFYKSTYIFLVIAMNSWVLHFFGYCSALMSQSSSKSNTNISLSPQIIFTYDLVYNWSDTVRLRIKNLII